jgi:prepilin-type N-terminal cleavage/methylation domain-containing protein
MQRGFTLVELMTVAAIIAGVTSLGLLMYARIARGDKAPAFARSILALVHEARSTALATGKPTLLKLLSTTGNNTIESKVCNSVDATQCTTSNWTSLSMLSRAPSDIELCTPQAGFQLPSAPPQCPLDTSGGHYVCFWPNGNVFSSGADDCTPNNKQQQIPGATLYVRTTDIGPNAPDGTHHYKIPIWGLTGMPKLLDVGLSW